MDKRGAIRLRHKGAEQWAVEAEKEVSRAKKAWVM